MIISFIKNVYPVGVARKSCEKDFSFFHNSFLLCKYGIMIRCNKIESGS